MNESLIAVLLFCFPGTVDRHKLDHIALACVIKKIEDYYDLTLCLRFVLQFLKIVCYSAELWIGNTDQSFDTTLLVLWTSNF